MLQAIHRFCLTLHFSKAGTNNHITKLIMGYYEISSSCFTTIYPCIEHLNMYKALLDMKNTSYDHTNKLGYASWVWKKYLAECWLYNTHTYIYIYIYIYIYTSHVLYVPSKHGLWASRVPSTIAQNSVCLGDFWFDSWEKKWGYTMVIHTVYITMNTRIPSGKHTKRAIENGHRNSGFTHSQLINLRTKWWFSSSQTVNIRLPEGINDGIHDGIHAFQDENCWDCRQT